MKKIVMFILVCLTIIPCASCKKENVFIYDIIDGKKEYRIVGIEELKNEEVTIPSEYKGLPVTEIGERAFAGESRISSVYIPDSVIIIGAYAFDDCRNLESLRLSTNIKIIPSHMTRNTRIKSIVIPDGVKRIENRAFTTLPAKEVIIPDSVEYIGYEAFYFSSLEVVVIGANIQEIQPYAFRYCDNLKSVTFKNPDNITLHGVTFKDGVLSNPEYVASLFLNEQYAMRHWFAKNSQ